MGGGVSGRRGWDSGNIGQGSVRFELCSCMAVKFGWVRGAEIAIPSLRCQNNLWRKVSIESSLK